MPGLREVQRTRRPGVLDARRECGSVRLSAVPSGVIVRHLAHVLLSGRPFRAENGVVVVR